METPLLVFYVMHVDVEVSAGFPAVLYKLILSSDRVAKHLRLKLPVSVCDLGPQNPGMHTLYYE